MDLSAHDGDSSCDISETSEGESLGLTHCFLSGTSFLESSFQVHKSVSEVDSVSPSHVPGTSLTSFHLSPSIVRSNLAVEEADLSDDLSNVFESERFGGDLSACSLS